jgi:hypothetical protein
MKKAINSNKKGKINMNFQKQAKVASLRAEAYAKLAEAEELEKEAVCDEPSMVGNPYQAPAMPAEKKEESDVITITIPQNVKMASLETLNKVSSELVKLGGEENIKCAQEIDMIASEIDKIAAAFESDKDEKYMKENFKGGLHGGDKDEKYMGEFNTDVSKEVHNALPAGGNTEVPYQKV